MAFHGAACSAPSSPSWCSRGVSRPTRGACWMRARRLVPIGRLRPARQLHQRGAGGRADLGALGHGRFRALPARSATGASCTRPSSRGRCCSPCCGGSPTGWARCGGRAWCRGRFWPVTPALPARSASCSRSLPWPDSLMGPFTAGIVHSSADDSGPDLDHAGGRQAHPGCRRCPPSKLTAAPAGFWRGWPSVSGGTVYPLSTATCRPASTIPNMDFGSGPIRSGQGPPSPRPRSARCSAS